jgi:N-methylhydantoinase A/oxoprolinase/acetone carboxylase beta subunit
VPLAELVRSYAVRRAVERLVERGLVVIAGFTPSDAAHVLGLQQGWSTAAARLGATLWLRRWRERPARAMPEDSEGFCRAVVEKVVQESARAIAATALAEQDGIELARSGAVGQRLIDRATAAPDDGSLLDLRLRLRCPLVAIGAPAALYYPEVAPRLGTRLVVPRHAEVCNAVGAVAGGVVQSLTALITSPGEGQFRVHLPASVHDFETLDDATAFAEAEADRLAAEQALTAGAATAEVRRETQDKIVRDAGGGEVFLERRILATAYGRPRIAQ